MTTIVELSDGRRIDLNSLKQMDIQRVERRLGQKQFAYFEDRPLVYLRVIYLEFYKSSPIELSYKEDTQMKEFEADRARIEEVWKRVGALFCRA